MRFTKLVCSVRRIHNDCFVMQSVIRSISDNLCVVSTHCLDFHTAVVISVYAIFAFVLSGFVFAFHDLWNVPYRMFFLICQLVASCMHRKHLVGNTSLQHQTIPQQCGKPDSSLTDHRCLGKNAWSGFLLGTGRKIQIKWFVSFQEISNRTFLTDPPKSLKMGSRARAPFSPSKRASDGARAREPKKGVCLIGPVSSFLESCPVWLFLISIIRVGEAKNPGPGFAVDNGGEFCIFHCNPTALLGKELEVASWGKGITLLSETSATIKAQKVIQANLRKCDFQTIWSKPVTPYRQSTGEMRGLAGGTAIISSYPIRQTLEPLPDDIVDSDRYTEAIVQISPGRYMFCVAIYGAVIGQRYHDSLGITNRLFSVAAQRAVRFQGPSIIVGDLNCDLDKLSSWPSLVKHGWIDSAIKSAEINNHEVEMTYDNITRHSYILTSKHLRNALLDCRTVKHFVFSKHPVIKLRLDLEHCLKARYVWQLPKSFDQFSHDVEKASIFAQQIIDKKDSKLKQCLETNDIDGIAKHWTVIAEETLRYSAVFKEHQESKPKMGHMGRAHKNPIQLKTQAIPIMKKPRDDHYIPNIDQGSVELRRHVKQLHRLQSLSSQVRALEQNYSEIADNQTQKLWESICRAKGFHVNFVHWMYAHGFICVPVKTPNRQFVDNLTATFHKHLRSLESDFRLYKSKIKQLEIIADLKHGGALAFREVQNDALPPLDEIRYEIRSAAKKVKWPKEGLVKIRF